MRRIRIKSILFDVKDSDSEILNSFFIYMSFNLKRNDFRNAIFAIYDYCRSILALCVT